MITGDALKRAKEVDLLTYLRSREPGELKRSGANEYRTVTHGSLVISNGYWYWNRGGFGGRSAIDYLIKVRGMGFVDAVNVVSGASGVRLAVPEARQASEPKRLILPDKTSIPAKAMAYLQGRGISPQVIRRCLEDDSLFEGRYSGAVCVFVGRDEYNISRFACMRGIDSNLKMDCVGSDKRFGFALPLVHSVGEESPTLAVFESPIDAMSHATLFPNENIHRLSLGGTSPLALITFLEREPQISEVKLCLDADEAGQSGSERIAVQLAGDKRFAHVAAEYTSSPKGKDYNEYLLLLRQRTQQQSRRRQAAISI
jgi:hypothetical protein